MRAGCIRGIVLVLIGAQSTSARAAGPHWSFLPIERPRVPVAAPEFQPRNAIDRFIAARLEQEGIEPAPDADLHTLIRRVTLDLIGLPPSPDDVSRFVADDRPDAYEQLVDRLLASPHYGERWTRVWLDLCHYGDSDGHLTDQLRPVAWRYRDWVLRALNSNMPFDEFTVLQLAGDLVAGESRRTTGNDELAERQVLGTGFLRQTLSNREGGADLEEYRVEQIVDRTSMVGAIWLGLTVGCARCHDHKYDPLTQREFYQLYACFDQADEVNIDAPLPEERAAWLAARPVYEQRRRELIEPYRAGLTELQQRWETKLLYAAAHPGEDHVWDRQWELLGLIWGGGLGEGQLEGTEIVKLPRDTRTPRQKDDLLDYFLQHGAIVDEQEFARQKLNELQQQLAALRQECPQAQASRAPVMRAALNPRQTYIHDSGDFRSRGPEVTPAPPAWLPGAEAGSGGRLELARWLVSDRNPLTARVAVNRMWQEFFGRGLVATEDDFGARGDPPSHSELLDWLACEFVDSRWDMKRMHRLIVTSATYRQSSRPRPELEQIDPDNILLARQSSLRVPAETVRDAALAVSGLLDTKLGGPGVFPPQSERVTMEAFGSNAWKTSTGPDRYRRGLYTFILRTSPFAQSITFDAPNPLAVCTRRDRSDTPLQALTLLNDPVFAELAAALGERIVREAGTSDDERLQFAVRLCLAREGIDAEIERLAEYLQLQRSSAADAEPDAGEQAAWTSVAGVLVNLHEFITRD